MTHLGTYACCARPVLPHHRHCPVCHALYAMADEAHVCAGETLRLAAEAVVQAHGTGQGLEAALRALGAVVREGETHG